MMRWIAIAGLVLTTACTQQAASLNRATPERAILYNYSVNVLASDGALCVANRPGRADEWQGVVKGCEHPWNVQVKGHDMAKGPRLPLSATTKPLTGPNVTVRNTTGGVWTFATP